jgi:hypothetical protein
MVCLNGRFPVDRTLLGGDGVPTRTSLLMCNKYGCCIRFLNPRPDWSSSTHNLAPCRFALPTLTYPCRTARIGNHFISPPRCTERRMQASKAGKTSPSSLPHCATQCCLAAARMHSCQDVTQPIRVNPWAEISNQSVSTPTPKPMGHASIYKMLHMPTSSYHHHAGYSINTCLLVFTRHVCHLVGYHCHAAWHATNSHKASIAQHLRLAIW